MITMTDAAIAKVAEYMTDEENKGKALRVFVEGGGCSGFQYGLAFDDQVDSVPDVNANTIVHDG